MMRLPFFLDFHVLSLSPDQAAAACQKVQEGLAASAKEKDRIGQWSPQHQEEGSVTQGHLLHCLWEREGVGMKDLEGTCAPAFVGSPLEPLPRSLAVGVLYGPSLDSVYAVIVGSDGQQEEVFTPAEELEDPSGQRLDLQKIWKQGGSAAAEVGSSALPVLLRDSHLFRRFRRAQAEAQMDADIPQATTERYEGPALRVRF